MRLRRPAAILTFCITGILSMAVFTARAQEIYRLDLTEAVDLGLESSKSLKIADSRVYQADAALKEARQARLPDLGLSGQYMRIVNTAKVRLNTGDETGEKGEAAGSGEGPPSPDYMMLGQASLSVPLFSGFRLNHAIRSAEYLQKAAELSAGADESEVILNIVSAWSNLVKAESAVHLTEENLRQARQRVEDFANLERNGLLARNDLLKAQLRASDVELALLEAQNNLKVTSYNMDLMLGLPEDTRLRADTISPAVLPEAALLAPLEDAALDDRKDLAAMEWQRLAALENVKTAEGERWPSVSLSAGYVAADLDDVLTVTNAVNAGIGISFNLASLLKTGAKVEQAKQEADQLRFSRQALSDQVKTEVHRAFSNYELSIKKIEVYEKAIVQANENYRIVRNKHENSLATTTDLLDADVAQLKARIDLAYARADAVVAWCELQKSAGQLDASTIAGAH